jgi:predicted  nucleic acid-binding Zn-ribbon protein
MKASENQQAELLSLANLDLEISRTKAGLSVLVAGEALAPLRANQRDAALALIQSRNALDSVELDLSRAESDLELVEQRISKDKTRLNQTSSSKDAQAIQSELETLGKRKSELEDLELNVLEHKEEIEATYKTVLADKQIIDEELIVAERASESEILKLRSGLDLLTQQRLQHVSRLEPALVELYEKKASRGVAVGRLLGRECGACRMSIGATALAEISALARDEIASCPDCQAVLIR